MAIYYIMANTTRVLRFCGVVDCTVKNTPLVSTVIVKQEG